MMGAEFDFYLSEMSISVGHGGGLTLQRIIGPELGGINLFALLGRFATDFPTEERHLPRYLELPGRFESDYARAIIGCTAASWLHHRATARRMHARRAARAVSARFPSITQPLLGLICPQGIASLYTLEALSRLRSIEYVTWIMDDQLIRWEGRGWRYPSGAEEMLSRHLRGAKCVFAISPAMAELYQKRFGVRSRVLFGPAIDYGEPVCDRPSQDACVSLGYFGALLDWQCGALKALARQLKLANARLDIYTAHRSAPTDLQVPGVTFKGRVPPSEVPSLMRCYDAVVLPASFEPRCRHLSELNIATKMSECLASGTLTLLIAPPYAAMVRFLESTGAAVIVQEETERAVVSAVERIRDQAERRPIIRAARDLVRDKLSAAAMRRTWMEGVACLATSSVSCR
jgi:hypothetical protein